MKSKRERIFIKSINKHFLPKDKLQNIFNRKTVKIGCNTEKWLKLIMKKKTYSTYIKKNNTKSRTSILLQTPKKLIFKKILLKI